MSKRIVICADGTWNRPERDPKRDHPSNVLRLARAVKPIGDDGVPQQVFYDWGVGSYHLIVLGGIAGVGIEKNVKDGYRYIVQNFDPGDELFLFGFSRGAYTVRSLAGFINSAGILKRAHAEQIERAFELYKDRDELTRPDGRQAILFRKQYAYPDDAARSIRFLGLWDTVGSLGIPKSLVIGGLVNKRYEFFDHKTGRNVERVRHALSIDEARLDFEPTLVERRDLDVKQVWFAGTHSDIGGGPRVDLRSLDEKEGYLPDFPLGWIMDEAEQAGLTLEGHLRDSLTDVPTAPLDPSRRYIFRLLPAYHRPIDHGHGPVLIHSSVKRRWDAMDDYRPPMLERYLDNVGGWAQATLVGPAVAANQRPRSAAE